MRGHQGREDGLVAPRKARHLRVGDDVAPVLVIAAVADRLADLVQARRPVEEALGIRHRQVPPPGDLLEELLRRDRHPPRLLLVDVVTLAVGADRLVADVLLPDAAEEIEDEALLQRPLGGVHALEPEAREEREEDRHPGGQNRRAIGGHPREIDRVHGSRRDQRLAQTLEPLLGDAVLAPAVGAEDRLDAGDRAARADDL